MSERFPPSFFEPAARKAYLNWTSKADSYAAEERQRRAARLQLGEQAEPVVVACAPPVKRRPVLKVIRGAKD